MANPVPVVSPVQQAAPAAVNPTLLQQLQMFTRTGGPEIRALREAQQQQELANAAAAAQQPVAPVGGTPGGGGFFPDIQGELSGYVQYLKDQFNQLHTDNNMGHRIERELDNAGVGADGVPKVQVQPQSSFDPRALKPQVRAVDLSRFG